ncbi:MAG: hypothetical protein HY322_05390 [Betaproteobacteria bacterium]|nr:hypothetical protein [Betaproteobacteria bacterium]
MAITGEKRTVALPKLPTYAEAGLPRYDPKNWQGILAPARTPSAIVTRLSGEVRKILDMPDIRERLVNSGMEPFHTGPELLGDLPLIPLTTRLDRGFLLGRRKPA